MAIIKKNDFEKLSAEELKDKLSQLRNELNRELGAKNVPGKKFNHGKVGEFRRTIARVLTKLRLLELQPKASEKSKTSHNEKSAKPSGPKKSAKEKNS